MRFKNIIFDFDGTLIDSRLGVVKAFKKVAKKLKDKEIAEQEIVQLIGEPLAQIITILLNTDDENIIRKGQVLFKKYYSKGGVYQNIVYPGIREMLESFKSQSRQLFVVSNKIELFMRKILEQHNLKKYFTFILGTEGANTQSKKSDQVKYLLTHYKLKKQETVIVGDTENDIIAAKKNFIYSIGVSWGYRSKLELVEAKADKVCSNPLELREFILENENRKTN